MAGQQVYLGNTLIYSENSFLGTMPVSFNNDYQPVIPQNGLVAWYDASNPASYPGIGSTWADVSPSAGSGSIVGSPTFNSTTKLFTFNGSSQRVDLTQIYSASQQTYSYYVIASAADTNTKLVFGQGTESNNQRAFMIRVGSYFGFNGYNNDNNTAVLVFQNQLKSIAFTMDTQAANQSEAIQFYVNGTFVSTSGTGGGATNLNMGTTAARIASNAGNGELFAGDIGVCIAYNRVLSAAEITTINNYYATKYTLV